MHTHSNSRFAIAAVLAITATVAGSAQAADGLGTLTWNRDSGLVWSAPGIELALDGANRPACPAVRIVPDQEFPLRDPTVHRESNTSLKLSYRVALLGKVAVDIVRCIEVKACGGGIAAVEDWSLTPSSPIVQDCEIERPLSVTLAAPGVWKQAILPLKNGWAKAVPLESGAVGGEYRLGHFLTGKETPELALPVVATAAGSEHAIAVMTDPTFSSLVELRSNANRITGTVRYRYAGSRVPLSKREERRFGFWLASTGTGDRPWERALDSFFSLMLPDVPPGPEWLHDIAMIDYDYLSDNGQGWDRDLRRLAEWLKPEERRRVALCLHGWYDAIGPYCFDAAAGQLKKEWVAFQPTRKVRLTQDDVRRRLRAARELGFRVLLYFGDGLASDSGVASYRDDWAYRDAQGEKIGGWQGPDTLGKTYLLNPAHPEVFRWYLAYADALLKTYGTEFDGLVWDETFHARTGQIAWKPEPAYCDRALMGLVKELARRVHAFDPHKVFLTSDCIGIPGLDDVPGYGMVAHGTWQDSWCYPSAWSYGLFPNWRNVLWSCNWSSISNYHFTRWAVRTYGVPVAISNGWGDDLGPSEWKPWQRDEIVGLFRERLRGQDRLRYLTEDPAALIARTLDSPTPGDPLPAPSPDLVNWALASQGSRATASSEDLPNYPAKGAIDGVRDDTGWGAGHGWASADKSPLPQWLEVDFGQPRTVSRAIVITYDRQGSMETAAKWGILDYEIQVWDETAKGWRTVANENRGRAARVRVHALSQAVNARQVRLLVHRVAPLDGRPRVLQLEAWGPQQR